MSARIRRRCLGLSVAAWLGLAVAAPDGARLYAERCATCHEHAQGHVPTRQSLATRSVSNILMALKTGPMRSQAAGLTLAEDRAIATYLTAGTQTTELRPNPCSGETAPMDAAGPGWNGWGRDVSNSRYQPRPGLTAERVPSLKVKWAFAYPGEMTWGQPTVVDGRIFITSPDGRVEALDARTGCSVWYLAGGTPVRTAISIGPTASSHTAAYYGDIAAVVHAVDADTGEEMWQTRVDEHPHARVTGAPLLAGNRLLVPVSSYEEGAASSADYPCCTFRGSVVALEAQTGVLLWKSSTLTETFQEYRRPDATKPLHGPAGASVWGTPTLDSARGLLYVGTGNNYTDIPAQTTDAVLAFELNGGSLRWVQQLSGDDRWVSGCTFGGPCPKATGPDADISASTILVHLRKGKDVLIAGQKSGVVYGLDPAANGKVLWRKKVGTGGVFGGIEWGMAAADGKVFVPISDSLPGTPEGARSGLAALDAETGNQLWWQPAPPPQCAWGPVDCRGAQSQAVTAIPGIVFSGSQDGHLRAYEARTGRIVWQFDTGGTFTPINAATAHGGSLDGGGPVVADGVLYLNSGYGQFMGRGGNVLLALSVDGK